MAKYTTTKYAQTVATSKSPWNSPKICNSKTKMEIMDHPNLPAMIKNHIVQGAHRLENMPDGTTLTTIGGTTITIKGGAVNGAKFKKNDIKVDNAIIHAVDAIIEA